MACWMVGIWTCIWAYSGSAQATSARHYATGSSIVNECEPAIRDAAQFYGLPEILLIAIGRVEAFHQGRIHPWAVNADGTPIFPQSKEQALELVAQLRQQGVRNMDMGCLQISSFWHQDAFVSDAEALTPRNNALYAAAHLRNLYAEAGNWMTAVGRYHHPSNQQSAWNYACRVEAELVDLGAQWSISTHCRGTP